MLETITENDLKYITNNDNLINISPNELTTVINNILLKKNYTDDTGKSLYVNLQREIDYYKKEFEAEQLHSIKILSDFEIYKNETDKEITNFDNHLNKLQKKNVDLTIKALNDVKIIKNYENKIKNLSDELEKTHSENKILCSEIDTLKNITSIKTSSSEYIDIEKNILNNNNNILNNNNQILDNNKNKQILLNTENICLLDNLKRGNNKTQIKNINYFQEEINKTNIKEPEPKNIFIKHNITYSTDYMVDILKNTDKIIKNNCNPLIDSVHLDVNLDTREHNTLKNNQKLEIIDEVEEVDEVDEVDEKKIENKPILGGYIPNTKGKPKNHIYEINGDKKMYIGNVFTTLTDQGDYNYHKKHLAYKRKNTRYNK